MSKKIDRNEAISFITEAMSTSNTTSSKSIVNLYNGMAEMLGQQPVKKFETREVANKRLASIAEQLCKQIGYDPSSAPPQQDEPQADVPDTTDDEPSSTSRPRVSGALAAKVKAAAAVKADKAAAAREAKAAAAAARTVTTSGGGRGKPSPHEGKSLHAVRDKNPRREGTCGWHSYEIIRKNPGITYEDYRKKGGRANDLAWDLDRQYVRVE